MANKSDMRDSLVLGKWTGRAIDRLLTRATEMEEIGERIVFLSQHFLGAPYKESTLIGDVSTQEALVINLTAFDCFTFLDSVEAMRLSSSFAEMKDRLRALRYKKGLVNYLTRNHFFTDWREYNRDLVSDVTVRVGHAGTQRVTKTLNVKDDGSLYLAGIEPFDRELTYVPSTAVDDSVLVRLKSGDYVGFFSASAGLDVSHVGIIVRKGAQILLRHASSAPSARKVVDQDFSGYISDKPGIIVLRPH
ncbi:MAG TPA: N-acetylmuramoyl-L-alanine amidase-like domain-containing protein [Syntrophorhabdaceae bacterium]|nr:N-acetylmuramoyl-L-alanine amidase-like domain-containing protein [Syntrophorhabdaceae bacterium]